MNKTTYGYEVEWGNIDKEVNIPPHIGYWEGNGVHAECDIMNKIDGKWEPIYPNKRWGGEINMTPADKETLIKNFIHLESLFDDKLVTPVQEGHIHVRPDWIDDVERVKEFALWMNDNYDEIISLCLDAEAINPNLHKSVRRYLKGDIGSRINKTALQRIKEAKTLDDLSKIDRRGTSTMRFPRFFVNFRPLAASSKTIEFRHFRMPITAKQFEDQLTFVEGLLNLEVIKGLDLPRLDPYNLFDTQEFIDATTYWWETREERKKLGKKVRMEW